MLTSHTIEQRSAYLTPFSVKSHIIHSLGSIGHIQFLLHFLLFLPVIFKYCSWTITKTDHALDLSCRSSCQPQYIAIFSHATIFFNVCARNVDKIALLFVKNYFVDCSFFQRPSVTLSKTCLLHPLTTPMVEQLAVQFLIMWAHHQSQLTACGDHVTHLCQRLGNSYLEWYSPSIWSDGLYQMKWEALQWHGFHHLNWRSRESQFCKGRKWSWHTEKSRDDTWREDLDSRSFLQLTPKAQLHSHPWISWENSDFLLINLSSLPVIWHWFLLLSTKTNTFLHIPLLISHHF